MFLLRNKPMYALLTKGLLILLNQKWYLVFCEKQFFSYGTVIVFHMVQ